MRLIRQLIRYFNPKPKFKRVPLQTINEYNIREASKEEILVMLANRARSPEVARELLKQQALEELVKPQPIKRVKFKTLLRRLILKMAGHQPGDPYRISQGNRGKNRL